MQANPSTLAPVLPQGCTNFKLRQLMRRVANHYDAEMAKCGLKTTQYSLLSHVLKLGPIRPGDLATEMKMDASTLTRNLRPLVDAGWVTLRRARTHAAAWCTSPTQAATSARKRNATGRPHNWR